jgi:K(+)-stimulated pyrophosphate-energized sodium pump
MFAPAGGAIALLFAFYLAGKISKADPGNATMIEIAGHIHEGAMAFLRRQYSAIAVFVVAVFLVLGFFID